MTHGSPGAQTSRGELLSPVVAGVVAAVAGFSSTFAVVLAGLAVVGASAEQAASGLLAVCVIQGVASIVLSTRYRLPLKVVWGTPGAVMLVATAGLTDRFGEAVGAFVVCGVLLIATGFWPALARAVERVPRPLAHAMLAGILLPLCLAPAQAVVALPAQAVPIVLVWLVLWRLAPRWAVPAAMLTAAVVLIAGGVNLGKASVLVPAPVMVWPEFDPLVVLGLGIPLYLVTMAGQNLPGIAIVSSFGYRVPVRGVLVGTGLASTVAAFFGGLTMNLAALTAALVAGPEAGEDRSRRWIAGVSAGATFCVLGLGAGIAASLVEQAPELIVQAVAGLALLGALAGALTAAFEQVAWRMPALVTLLVGASGTTVLGIGPAFWALLAGAVVAAWARVGSRSAA